MNDIQRGQVIRSAAEIYDQFFLPALFEEWAGPVVAAGRIEPGHAVLDIACGTGVVTLAAAEQVGPAGTVVGLDINEGMLDVARSKRPDIDWRHGRAEALPFPDGSFDAVTCQFALMFFDDRQAAVREMARVLRPGGRLAVAVWDSLDKTPGYAAVTRLLRRLFGEEAADSLHAPFVLGDSDLLPPLFAGDGLADVTIKTRRGTARFPSVDDWMFTDVNGWTLAGRLTDEQFERLCREAKKELQRFVGLDGRVAFDSPAHIITAVKI